MSEKQNERLDSSAAKKALARRIRRERVVLNEGLPLEMQEAAALLEQEKGVEVWRVDGSDGNTYLKPNRAFVLGVLPHIPNILRGQVGPWSTLSRWARGDTKARGD